MASILRLVAATLCVAATHGEPLSQALQRRSSLGVYAGDFAGLEAYEPVAIAALPLHSPLPFPVLQVLSRYPLSAPAAPAPPAPRARYGHAGPSPGSHAQGSSYSPQRLQHPAPAHSPPMYQQAQESAYAPVFPHTDEEYAHPHPASYAAASTAYNTLHSYAPASTAYNTLHSYAPASTAYNTLPAYATAFSTTDHNAAAGNTIIFASKPNGRVKGAVINTKSAEDDTPIPVPAGKVLYAQLNKHGEYTYYERPVVRSAPRRRRRPPTVIRIHKHRIIRY